MFFKTDETANGGYDVDHGAALILVNPQGQYAGVITAPHIESTISEDLIALANYAGVKPSTATGVLPTNNVTAAPTTSTKAIKASQSLVFKNAWIRPTPPGVPAMAAYFDLVNTSDQDIVINQSNSPAFDMTMIHTTVIEDGIASMEHMDQLIIPANGKVSLKPLGIHMMLMRPTEPLVAGDSTTVVLVGENGEQYQHLVTVKEQED